MKKIAPLTQATWSQKSSFSQFSHRQKWFFLRGKIAKNQLHLAKFGCVSGAISIFRNLFFDKLEFSLNTAGLMQPNGPKCLRNG